MVGTRRRVEPDSEPQPVDEETSARLKRMLEIDACGALGGHRDGPAQKKLRTEDEVRTYTWRGQKYVIDENTPQEWLDHDRLAREERLRKAGRDPKDVPVGKGKKRKAVSLPAAKAEKEGASNGNARSHGHLGKTKTPEVRSVKTQKSAAKALNAKSPRPISPKPQPSKPNSSKARTVKARNHGRRGVLHKKTQARDKRLNTVTSQKAASSNSQIKKASKDEKRSGPDSDQVISQISTSNENGDQNNNDSDDDDDDDDYEGGDEIPLYAVRGGAKIARQICKIRAWARSQGLQTERAPESVLLNKSVEKMARAASDCRKHLRAFLDDATNLAKANRQCSALREKARKLDQASSKRADSAVASASATANVPLNDPPPLPQPGLATADATSPRSASSELYSGHCSHALPDLPHDSSQSPHRWTLHASDFPSLAAGSGRAEVSLVRGNISEDAVAIKRRAAREMALVQQWDAVVGTEGQQT